MYYHSTYLSIGISSYARGLRRSLLDLRSGTVSITPRPQLGDFVARFSTYARGLTRSLSDHSSGTSSLASRPTLGDCLDHSPTTARGLRRSLLTHGDCLDHSPTTAWGLRCSLLDLCSGTASTTLRPWLGDFIARSSTCARGLPRPLSNHGSGTLRLDYMRLATHI